MRPVRLGKFLLVAAAALGGAWAGAQTFELDELAVLKADAKTVGCTAELDAVLGSPFMSAPAMELSNRIFNNIQFLGYPRDALRKLALEPLRSFKKASNQAELDRAWKSYNEVLERSSTSPVMRAEEGKMWRAFEASATRLHTCMTTRKTQRFAKAAEDERQAATLERPAFQAEVERLKPNSIWFECAKSAPSQPQDVETYYFLRTDSTGFIRSSGSSAKNPNGGLCRSADHKWKRLDDDRWVAEFTTSTSDKRCGVSEKDQAGSLFISQQLGPDRASITEFALNAEHLKEASQGRSSGGAPTISRLTCVLKRNLG